MTARSPQPAMAPAGTPRFWRPTLDDLGQRSSRGEVVIFAERCKGCGFCVEYCPCDVLALAAGFNRKGYHPPEVVAAGECLACNLCEMICPEFAIYSVQLESAPGGRETEML